MYRACFALCTYAHEFICLFCLSVPIFDFWDYDCTITLCDLYWFFFFRGVLNIPPNRRPANRLGLLQIIRHPGKSVYAVV